MPPPPLLTGVAGSPSMSLRSCGSSKRPEADNESVSSALAVDGSGIVPSASKIAFINECSSERSDPSARVDFSTCDEAEGTVLGGSSSLVLFTTIVESASFPSSASSVTCDSAAVDDDGFCSKSVSSSFA